MARACGKYLMASSKASVAEIRDEVLTKRGRYSKFKDNLQAKEVIVRDGERRRRYILCYNPKEAKRQKKHREQVVDILEKELERHPDRKATAQWAMDLLAPRRYKRYLAITKGGKVRIDRGKVRQAAKYDGKWVLKTNDDTISLEDAACGYTWGWSERCARAQRGEYLANHI